MLTFIGPMKSPTTLPFKSDKNTPRNRLFPRSRDGSFIAEGAGKKSSSNGLGKIGWFIIVVNLLGLLFLFTYVKVGSTSCQNVNCPVMASQFVGGNIMKAPEGSCWCGKSDGYCMCTPSLAIDAIIEFFDKDDIVHSSGIVIGTKEHDSAPPKLALVGGFVEVGETSEEAVIREVWEETHLIVSDLTLFPHVYTDPKRDSRRHVASIVYSMRTTGNPKAGDDLASVRTISHEELKNLVDSSPGIFFADHAKILKDYYLSSSGTVQQRN